jgi:ketosteroid isomerase-like protein
MLPCALVLSAAAAPDATPLLRADREFGEAGARLTAGGAVAGALADDALVLLPGAPILYGRSSAGDYLDLQPMLAEETLQWQPLHAELSNDGATGMTWGVVVAVPKQPRAAVRFGRYLAVWRSAAGRWHAAAYALVLPVSLPLQKAVEVPSRPLPASAPGTAEELDRTDREFAERARHGVGDAFVGFAAPDAILFASSGELRRGAPAIGRGFADWDPKATLEWKPVYGWASASGDLGFTVGEAVYSAPGEAGAVERSGAKYLTVWKRQADGAWKYVADAGNSRPLPAAR